MDVRGEGFGGWAKKVKGLEVLISSYKTVTGV